MFTKIIISLSSRSNKIINNIDNNIIYSSMINSSLKYFDMQYRYIKNSHYLFIFKHVSHVLVMYNLERLD